MLFELFLIARGNKEYTKLAHSYNYLIAQRNHNPAFFDMDTSKMDELHRYVTLLDKLIFNQKMYYQVIVFENERNRSDSIKAKCKLKRLYEIKERLELYQQIDKH